MSNISVPNLIVILDNTQWYFNYIILPICFILGSIGNCLSLIIFCQRSSRSNSCLLYFLSASIANIFILNFGLVLRILRGIWNIDPAVKSVWFCRWRNYIITSSFFIYRYSILLACINRMCVSSRSARMRTLSRPRITRRLITITWILCCVCYIPSLLFPEIVYGQCLVPPGTKHAINLTLSTLIQGLFIPSSMIICGIITVNHLKLMQSRVTPITTNVHRERRVISKFIIMLFVQVASDFLFNVLYPCYLIYNLFFPATQMLEITPISSFVVNMSFTLPYINYSAAFYLHIFSSPSFRRKLLRLIRRIACFHT